MVLFEGTNVDKKKFAKITMKETFLYLWIRREYFPFINVVENLDGWIKSDK